MVKILRIEIVPQDGKSLTTDYEALIISSAIEDLYSWSRKKPRILEYRLSNAPNYWLVF